MRGGRCSEYLHEAMNVQTLENVSECKLRCCMEPFMAACDGVVLVFGARGGRSISCQLLQVYDPMLKSCEDALSAENVRLMQLINRTEEFNQEITNYNQRMERKKASFSWNAVGDQAEHVTAF
ncbi:hypothetical protein BV898_05165 [Hypsibius exemplaris]|uniref:Uncharacterized protein n=1 Tax=Hypsibius exemplaris TaxID=2072580 RepID=A0A1W0X037_HYPEX|nr:hypothetical protein BV898_05165 [Hypsibius exemplaris]